MNIFTILKITKICSKIDIGGYEHYSTRGSNIVRKTPHTKIYKRFRFVTIQILKFDLEHIYGSYLRLSQLFVAGVLYFFSRFMHIRYIQLHNLLWEI